MVRGMVTTLLFGALNFHRARSRVALQVRGWLIPLALRQRQLDELDESLRATCLVRRIGTVNSCRSSIFQSASSRQARTSHCKRGVFSGWAVIHRFGQTRPDGRQR
jgi:hypothetical protein